MESASTGEQETLSAIRNAMSVGEQTVSDASPQRGEVGRGAHRGRCIPRLLARLGFPPPASPRWGEIQDGGHVAGGASARASPLFPIMSVVLIVIARNIRSRGLSCAPARRRSSAFRWYASDRGQKEPGPGSKSAGLAQRLLQRETFSTLRCDRRQTESCSGGCGRGRSCPGARLSLRRTSFPLRPLVPGL